MFKSIPAKFARLTTIHITPFLNKNNFKSNNMYKKLLHTNNLYIKPSHTSNIHTKNSHKNTFMVFFSRLFKAQSKNIQLMHVYPNYYKKNVHFFSSQSIRMSGNSIIFEDKKI